MVRPPRSTETLEAQRAIDRARNLLGSPSVPPEEFESEEVTKTDIGWPPKEQPTGPLDLHRYANGFQNPWARLAFLVAFMAFIAYLLGSGIIHIGIVSQK